MVFFKQKDLIDKFKLWTCVLWKKFIGFKYFESRAERFYKGDKLEGEVFPEKAYQFGATPEFIEKAFVKSLL